MYWSGKIEPERSTQTDNQPSDAEFAEHFTSLLDPDNRQTMQLTNFCEGPSIPVTDDVISVEEVEKAIKATRTNASSGPSGIPAGILKPMTPAWILFLAHLFNAVLLGACYPLSWTCARLVTIFKSRVKNDCSNYRGISIMDVVAKLC